MKLLILLAFFLAYLLVSLGLVLLDQVNRQVRFGWLCLGRPGYQQPGVVTLQTVTQAPGTYQGSWEPQVDISVDFPLNLIQLVPFLSTLFLQGYQEYLVGQQVLLRNMLECWSLWCRPQCHAFHNYVVEWMLLYKRSK